jgi:hypothetical protein
MKLLLMLEDAFLSLDGKPFERGTSVRGDAVGSVYNAPSLFP